MIGVFPTLQPEELLYSAFARYSAMMRYPSTRAVSEDLFGKPYVVPAFDLPCHLTTFLSRLPPGHPYSCGKLIWQHTHFPYYERFLPRERAASLAEAMRRERGGVVHSAIGVMASRVPTPSHLQFCPRCAAADTQRIGMAYWRRVHQLPGVLVCPDHRMPLFRSSVRRVERVSRHAYFALDATVIETGEAIDVSGVPTNVLDRIASDSQWLLANGARPEGYEALTRRYRAHLIRRGWTWRGSHLRATDFSEAFVAHFGREVLAHLGCPVSPDVNDRGAWHLRIVRRLRATKHPLLHLLILQFLEVSADEFFSAPMTEALSTAAEAVLASGEPCLNRLCNRYDGDARPRVEAREVGAPTARRSRAGTAATPTRPVAPTGGPSSCRTDGSGMRACGRWWRTAASRLPPSRVGWASLWAPLSTRR